MAFAFASVRVRVRKTYSHYITTSISRVVELFQEELQLILCYHFMTAPLQFIVIRFTLELNNVETNLIYQHVFKQIRCDVYSTAVLWFRWFAARNNKFLLLEDLTVSSCMLIALAKSSNIRFHF